MPRLLLVDDNPSIHRIAESLLAPTDVELVCVDSAAEALDLLGRGEHFDVALVDTAMPGMDGWTLLGRLRGMDGTARMPIALMAGVLDPVDPAKLAKAPIQGFLKKPIELRELGDRVKALLATPVAPSPSPFSTVPSTPAQDLVRKAEDALPELRPAPAVPESILSVDLDLTAPEGDLLVLTADDLWPEETLRSEETLRPEETLRSVPDPDLNPLHDPNPLPDVHLELEELDLDSLQDLTAEPLSAPTSAPPVFELDGLLPGVAKDGDEDELVTLSGLDDLEPFPLEPVHPPAAAAHPGDAPSGLPEAGAVIGSAALAGLAAEALVAKDHEPVFAAEAPAEAPSAADGQALAAPGQLAAGALAAPAPLPAAASPALPAPAPSEPANVSSDQARALVQALLADPVLVDALVRAVVARMGDQVLREIAWELMPDVAGRLQR